MELSHGVVRWVSKIWDLIFNGSRAPRGLFYNQTLHSATTRDVLLFFKAIKMGVMGVMWVGCFLRGSLKCSSG